MSKPKTKRSIGITALLSGAIAGLVLLSVGLALTLSSLTAWRNTFELLNSQAAWAMSSIEAEIRAHVQPAMEISRYLRAQVDAGEIHPDNSDELIAAFRGALAAAPQIAGVVLWGKDNSQLGVMRGAGDAATVFREAPTTPPPVQARLVALSRHFRRPVWGPPDEGSATANYIYTIAPLDYRGEEWGVLATGVTISNLSSIIKRIGAQLGMTAFILYNVKVLGHPVFETLQPTIRDGKARLPTIDQLGDPIVSQFYASEVLNQNSGNDFELREITHPDDGQDYVVLSRSNNEFGGQPWQIGVYGPAATFGKQIDRLVGSAMAGLGVLALALLCALWIARRISRPIRNLADSAEHIGRLELDRVGDIPHAGIQELDDQAGAFNRMVYGLRWFETYVPKRLVRQLIHERGGDASIASKEVELTVMFTDIIGFTATSQAMPPAEVGAMLNAHFEIIASCIEAEGGTLDKFIGDAVMAFWGAPEEQTDHAARACRAALALAAALQEPLGAERHSPLRIKVAIHSGPLLVGNIGATSRMNYTVIGDTVNTCSRIESLCAKFDDGAASVILVSAATATLASDDSTLKFEEVGGHQVKGRSAEVRLSRLRAADA